MKRQFLKTFFLLFFFLIAPNFSKAAPVPVLNFSDIDSGPKTGNTDGQGSGAIVTIWGNYLGQSQGSSKIYVGNAEVTSVYYWKNADGQLPGGPADLYTYHKMQEISFAIPVDAPDGLTTIKVVVNGTDSTTLPFTIRSGNIYFVKSSGNDTTGNGSWSNPWATLQNVFNKGGTKINAGDIVYTTVGSNAGLVVGMTGPVKGTKSSPVSLLAYPNSAIAITGQGSSGYVIQNYWNTDNTLSSEYINFSKLKIVASGNGTDASSGIHTFKGNRIVGVEITGPTVYGGYGGAITGSGGGNGNVGSGENAGGGKYLGIYMHDYGYQSTTPGVNNYGWVFDKNSATWTSPSYDGIGDACTNCTTVDRFQHLYYISDRSPDSIEGYEIGWNYLTDNPILSGIHIYDQGPNVGGWSSPIYIHDSVVKNQRASSIDVTIPKADVGPNAGTAAPVYIYNNIIENDPDYLGNGWALNIQGSSLVKVYNNTIYGYRYINIMRPGTSDYRNNIMHEVNVPLDFTYFVYDTPTSKSNNLFYGTHSSPMPAWFSIANGDKNANPLFTDSGNHDFSLQQASPAIAAGTDATLSDAPRDFFGQPRPAGSVSMGAIQYFASQTDFIAPQAPSGLTVN